MKILQVITSLRTGGAEKLMIDIIPELKKEGHEVDLLIFDGTETPFKKKAEELGIHVISLNNGVSVYSPSNLLKLRSFLSKYHIIHTHNTACQLFAALGSLGKKVNLITTEHNTSNRRRDKKWLKPLDKWMYSRYKYVINISQKSEDNLRQHIGKSKARICTINNGINLSSFIDANPSKELEELAPNSKKILMIAGFREQKDHPSLIKALKNLPDDFHLFLVGDGSTRKILEELVTVENLNSRVHFMGIRTDIPELLHASDFIVMSSHYEGLSLSSVEGMCVGKPFIASNVDGLQEVVEGAGILFPHQNSEALAKEILKLDSDRLYYEKTAQKCLERAKQFDISKMVDGYLDIYDAIFAS